MADSGGGKPHQVVFIDATVPDLQDLLNGLAPGARAFVIDPGHDGLRQIAHILTTHHLSDLSSISIVGHGSSGAIEVGGTTLDDADLSTYAPDLSRIGAALTPGGELELYACDTAAGSAGQQFIADLSQYAGGVSVAAATQTIGLTDGSENWTLDASAGPAPAQTPAPFTADALANFQGQLPATPTADLWAAISANNHASFILSADSTGTGNGTSETSASELDTGTTLTNPSSIQIDPQDGVYFVVENDNPSSSASDDVILEGAIANALNGTPNLKTIYTDTTGGDDISGLSVDVADNELFFTISNVDFTAGSFDRLNFAGPGNFNDTSLPTAKTLYSTANPIGIPGQSAITSLALNTTTPSNEAAYFIQGSASFGSQGSTNFSTFQIEKASWSTSSPNSVTVSNIGGFFPSADGRPEAVALDTINNTLYIATDPGASGSKAGVYALNLGTDSLSLVLAQGTTFGSNAFIDGITVDAQTGTYYLSVDNLETASPNQDTSAIWVGAITGGPPAEFDGTHVGDGTSTQTGNDPIPVGLAVDNAPTLAGVTGTATDAVQGGAALTLLATTPTISDSDNTEAAGATIQITNGKTGDELFVNGQQSGTQDSGKVTVSWNPSTFTLTLTGADTLAEYQTLLQSVTYKDTGTDTTSGSHPTRTVAWSVSDGLLSSSADDTTVTVDRPPVASTQSFKVAEGATATGTSGTSGTGALHGDSDLDGDSLSVSSVNGSAGNVGASVNGTYGALTLNSNGSFTYTASNTTAINAAATGSHPTDTFNYVVSDGHGGTASTTISFAVDRAPAVSVATSANYTFSESAVVLSPSVSVSDPDGDNIASATVQITGGTFTGDDDVLAATTAGTGISQSYNQSSETLTLTGSASAATYQQVLESVTFDSTNPEPTDNGADPSRTVAWSVSDGTLSSTTADETINITPCYCPGTLIKTKLGQKKVEKLKIGDEVMNASGDARPIKWIGRRSYNGRFVMGRKDILPVCIKAGALDDNVPKRDLWISPNHAMFLGGMLIEAKDLLNGVSIVQAKSVESVEYVHIELETHDVVIAEGAFAESYIDDDNRALFHNAHEYFEKYPKVAAGSAHYCAPRCDDGYAVEAVRRRIALRAGLSVVESETPAGALRGYVDRVCEQCIAGWAQNADYPEAPVCLDILAGGVLIGQVLANRYRADLARAGYGSGHHGFKFTPPAGLTFTGADVEVRRSLDRALIELTEDAARVHRQTAA